MSGARGRLLLATVVLVWAVSWPVIKIGVSVMPPLWYGCARYIVAAGCLFPVVALNRRLVWPSRSDWRLVAVSAVFQMAAYSALAGVALTRLPPGRSSVLAYSTPVWVVPLAAWRLGERLSWRAIGGVVAGVAGVLVIAGPGFRPGGGGQALAYAMLLGAAAAWAVSIVFVRAHRFEASAFALAPWQMLLAAALLCLVATVVEGAPPAIGARGLASLAYVGPVATALGYWAIVEAGRCLRASALSVGLLATPTLGVLVSALTLGERVTGGLVLGMALVGAGIWLASRAPGERSPGNIEARAPVPGRTSPGSRPATP